MSLWAMLVNEIADAGLAGLSHSQFAYQSPQAAAKQKEKASGCTPCAAAARLERAQHAVKVATGQITAPQRRPRRAA